MHMNMNKIYQVPKPRERIISNFMKWYTYYFILGNLINWTYLTACCVKENREITLFP